MEPKPPQASLVGSVPLLPPAYCALGPAGRRPSIRAPISKSQSPDKRVIDPYSHPNICPTTLFRDNAMVVDLRVDGKQNYRSLLNRSVLIPEWSISKQIDLGVWEKREEIVLFPKFVDGSFKHSPPKVRD